MNERLNKMWLDFNLGIFPQTSEDWRFFFDNVEVSEEAKEVERKN